MKTIYTFHKVERKLIAYLHIHPFDGWGVWTSPLDRIATFHGQTAERDARAFAESDAAWEALWANVRAIVYQFSGLDQPKNRNSVEVEDDIDYGDDIKEDMARLIRAGRVTERAEP